MLSFCSFDRVLQTAIFHFKHQICRAVQVQMMPTMSQSQSCRERTINDQIKIRVTGHTPDLVHSLEMVVLHLAWPRGTTGTSS
eukprot:366444-Chlamydomonas_euryale.AAC.23